METNKSKAQLKSEFTTFFEKEAAPLLGEYETNRKKNKFLWICLCLFATSCLIMLFFPLIGLSLLILSIALMMIHDFFFKEKSNCVLGDVEMNLKTTLMPKFLKIFGEFKWSKYRPEKYKTAASELRALNIFPKISTLGFDDMIEGKYLGINIEIVEVLTGRYNFPWAVGVIFFCMVFLPLYIGLFAIIILTVIGIVSLITKNPNIQAFITLSIPIIMFIILPIVFSSLDSSLRGVAVTCKIPKHFKGKTFLYENAPTNRKLILKDRTGMEKVNIEDVNFNKMYTVLSTDQVEARYLLTTTFIERFQNIKTAFNAKYIRAEFKNGELILFIGVNKDMFAMGNIAKQTTYKTFFELFEEIYSILSLIEHLKLNQNIGL